MYDRLKQNDITAFDNIHLDTSVPVLTVCAEGKLSLMAADMLMQKGYNASSLQSGMKGWSLAWNTTYQPFYNFELWQVRRTGKGCLSYIVASSKEAIIVDASLPLEVYTHAARMQKMKIKKMMYQMICMFCSNRCRTLIFFRANKFELIMLSNSFK